MGSVSQRTIGFTSAVITPAVLDIATTLQFLLSSPVLEELLRLFPSFSVSID
jgi:hypothetical protein